MMLEGCVIKARRHFGDKGSCARANHLRNDHFPSGAGILIGTLFHERGGNHDGHKGLRRGRIFDAWAGASGLIGSRWANRVTQVTAK